MILDGKGLYFFAHKALERIIIEIYMRKLNVFMFQRIDIDAEAVILAGNFDFAGFEIFNRVVCAAMSEFQFISFAAECQAKKLMSKTDSEYRYFAEKFANSFNSIS